MLIEFKVANYRSIHAEQTLSMVANADKELPQNLISCDHVPGLKGTNLVKAVALYGANASGKSNVVAALRFFAVFVRESATKLQPGAPTGAQPFKLEPACLTQPSKFEITAVINGIRTLYGIEMTRERVTSEYLVAYPKGRPQVWFERDWNAAKGKYEWSKSTAHFKHDDALREKTRENATFLSVATQFAHAEAKSITDWFDLQLNPLDTLASLSRASRARHMLTDEFWREKIAPALAKADLGITGVQIRQPNELELALEKLRMLPRSEEEWRRMIHGSQQVSTDSPPDDQLMKELEILQMPEFLHQGSNATSVPLHFFEEESTGTQRYAALLAEMLVARALAKVLIGDEFDSSLHPILIRELLSFFFSSAGFGAPGQLIFTTHNPLLLDQTLLRRDQIWFTEKDKEGATRLYPLTDFKPRKDESLVKGYLAGRYGGIPFIPEGLKF